jgi:hypothetical protein
VLLALLVGDPNTATNTTINQQKKRKKEAWAIVGIGSGVSCSANEVGQSSAAVGRSNLLFVDVDVVGVVSW